MNNNSELFENYKNRLLQQLVLERDKLAFNLEGEPKSLFELDSINEKLYKKILEKLNVIALNCSCDLIIDLCNAHKIKIEDLRQYRAAYDLRVNFQDRSSFISIKPSSLKVTIDDMKADIDSFNLTDKNKVFITVLTTKEDEIFSDCEESSLKIWSFKHLLFKLFGKEELTVFENTFASFENDIQNTIGYKVTEVLNDTNLSILKKDLTEEFKLCNYDLLKERTSKELKEQNSSFSELYDSTFFDIKSSFLLKERYKILFSNHNFSKSFLSSSWLFKQYLFNKQLDNTYIVAGYLKSIEQLLWFLVSKLGKGRFIHSSGTEKIINEKYIETTLGDLEYFVGNYSNSDLFITDSSFFCKYLKALLGLWRTRYRNGFFHKHNLESAETVIKIKEETYFLYCMILGSIDCDSI